MEKKNHDDGADNETLFDQFFLQRGDGSEYEIGTVIGADDLYAGRKRRLDIFDLLLDAIDQIQSVLPMAHYHDAPGHFAFAIQLGDAAPHVRSQGHGSNVSH